MGLFNKKPKEKNEIENKVLKIKQRKVKNILI